MTSGSRHGLRIHRIAVSVALASLLLIPRAGHARIFLIVVDGLDAREVTDDATPTLARAWRESRWCPNARSLASMPTRTNSNHATLLTGVTPAAHGVTGNAVWDPALGRARKLDTASDILAETTFTLAHRAAHGLRTAVAVGKPKLGMLLSADGDRQRGPDELWDGRAASDSSKDEVTGYAYDATTLAAARAFVEHGTPDFLFVNLSDVDRVSHGAGPRSPQAVETRRRTDAALAAFLARLAARPDWSATTVVITADHGFDTMTNPAVRFDDALAANGLPGLVTVGDGGTGHVYLRSPGNRARDARALKRARRVALAHPAMAEALYRRANELDGGAAHTLARVHPDWHLEHERAGDLVLITKPGYQIVDGSEGEARLIGNHGGPAERSVPLIVLGGAPTGPSESCEGVTATDLGRTVQACLGLPAAQRLDGHAVAPADRGRELRGMCPHVASQALAEPVTPP